MDKRIEEHLLNPPPGSKAAAAKEFGIDLTLTLRNLRLTPDQRVRNMQQAMISLDRFQRETAAWRKQNKGCRSYLTKKTLERGNNFTFETDLGDLDLLGNVAGVGDFDSLAPSAITME